MNRPITTAATIAAQRGRFFLENRPATGLPTMPNPALGYTVQAELMQLGYMLDERAFSCLLKLPNEDIIRYHDEVVAYARYIKGDGAYRPLYSGFPQQVMELTDMELFWNACLHYMSDGTWEPNAYTKSRPTAFEHPSYKMLTVCCEGDFMRIFTDILAVNQSITPMDKEALQWFVTSYGGQDDFWSLLPKEIPFRENLCFLLSIAPVTTFNYTLTDILRMATYLSEGDVSLATSTKFRLTGAMRKKVMYMLEWYVCRQGERTGEKFLQSLEDMKIHRAKWLALLRHIHADSKPFRKAYPEAQRVINLIRWHEKHIRTWNSRVEYTEDPDKKLRLLSQRPGELARRLNSLLKSALVEFKDIRNPLCLSVLHTFASVAEDISNKVLFELFGYFEGRRKDQGQRTIFVKGSRKPVQLPPQAAMPSNVVDAVQQIIVAAIGQKFAAWPPMGDVLIDERLKNIPLPTNMRTVSETDVPVVRGTRLPINGKAEKTIRFYVHWDDPDGSEDLDLSATLLGMGRKGHISWDSNYLLRAFKGIKSLKDLNDPEKVIAIHSGDVRFRKGACAEYIDLIPASALAVGYRYAIIDVRNYQGRSLKSVNPAFGYMEREHPEANPQWVPSTVTASMRLQSEAKACIAVMVDLETMEYIPMDIDSSCITATGDLEAVLSAMRMYMEPPCLSVYDLLTWHVQARGGKVVKTSTENFNDAKEPKDLKVHTIFSFSDFSTSYIEVLKLMADNPPSEEPGTIPPYAPPGPPPP